MTDCSRFEDDLKAFADGELPWLRQIALRRHLTRCASCREEITAMTQIAEDLRATEVEDALSPTLREKILADSALTPDNGGIEKARTNSGSPIIGGGGASPRKRPALGWGIAAVALVGWFLLLPMFSKVRENARRVIPATSSTAGLNSPRAIGLRNSLSASRSISKSTFANDGAVNDQNGIVGQPVSHLPPSGYKSPAITGTAGVITIAGSGEDSLRQVHKEASIGIQVANPEATGDTVATMVKETGGYVAANNLSTEDDGLKTGELIVKVPVTQFEIFLAQVAKLGNVQSKNISGEDITEKTSDANQTESVLEDDLQQSEARLKSLGSRAKWHDQEATRDLRIQLAQARARLILLKRMAALGTITVDLSQTPKAAAPPPVTGGFLNNLKATTHDALQSLVGSAGALLALLIWLLAYAPIWVTLLVLGRYAHSAYRKREMGA